MYSGIYRYLHSTLTKLAKAPKHREKNGYVSQYVAGMETRKLRHLNYFSSMFAFFYCRLLKDMADDNNVKVITKLGKICYTGVLQWFRKELGVLPALNVNESQDTYAESAVDLVFFHVVGKQQIISRCQLVVIRNFSSSHECLYVSYFVQQHPATVAALSICINLNN